MKSFYTGVILGTSILLSVSSLMGRDQMPLPPIFFEAKTIAIVNDAGESDFGDKAYDELKKWGRYTIVSDPKQADLVLVITTRENYVGTVGRGNSQTSVSIDGNGGTATTYSTQSSQAVTQGKTFIMFLDGKSGERVWSDGRNWGRFKSATRGIIKDLRKRVESQAKKK